MVHKRKITFITSIFHGRLRFYWRESSLQPREAGRCQRSEVSNVVCVESRKRKLFSPFLFFSPFSFFFCLDRWKGRYLEILSLKFRMPLANLFFINLSKDIMKWFTESTFLLYQFDTESLSEDSAFSWLNGLRNVWVWNKDIRADGTEMERWDGALKCTSEEKGVWKYYTSYSVKIKMCIY